MGLAISRPMRAAARAAAAPRIALIRKTDRGEVGQEPPHDDGLFDHLNLSNWRRRGVWMVCTHGRRFRVWSGRGAIDEQLASRCIVQGESRSCRTSSTPLVLEHFHDVVERRAGCVDLSCHEGGNGSRFIAGGFLGDAGCARFDSVEHEQSEPEGKGADDEGKCNEDLETNGNAFGADAGKPSGDEGHQQNQADGAGEYEDESNHASSP